MAAEFVYPKHSGSRKAAILLLTLGDDVAREVFRRLSEPELKQLNQVAQQLNDVSVGEVLSTLMVLCTAAHAPFTGAGQSTRHWLHVGSRDLLRPTLLTLLSE